MTVRIYVTGFVQNVGFRQYIKYKAKRLNVQGWVKNLSDGSVEVFAQGTPQNVEKLIEICKKGPFLASVKEIKVKQEKEATDLISFTVIK